MPPAELFTRAGQFLCGPGPKWKEQFANMLRIQTNTVDNMSKGASRPASGRRSLATFRIANNMPAASWQQCSWRPSPHSLANLISSGWSPTSLGGLIFLERRLSNRFRGGGNRPLTCPSCSSTAFAMVQSSEHTNSEFRER